VLDKQFFSLILDELGDAPVSMEKLSHSLKNKFQF
jgi:hypothetical protein